jgi:DDE superfamily endonuclease
VAETLADSRKPPSDLGISPGSVRLMADRLGISFSIDPELEPKLRDVVGLYMSPPENAVVVSIDEKSQIQALDRTRPDQPLEKGPAAARTHDNKRNGTTTLFAALDIATGKLSTDKCYQKHTNAEFVDFPGIVAAAHPDVELHDICDNYATRKHPNVKAWLAANPWGRMHSTPTNCSWLNMV